LFLKHSCTLNLLCHNSFPRGGMSGYKHRLVVIDAQDGFFLEWIQNKFILLGRFACYLL